MLFYCIIIMTEYNIILNANNVSTGTNNQKTYFFDWSLLPEGKYSVNFSYQGQANNLTGGSIAMLYINLNQHNNYEIGPTNLFTGQYLGFVRPFTLGASSYLYANDGDNCSFTIDNKPNQNNITVSIYNNSNPQTLYQDATPAPPASYILNLRLTLLE